MNAFVFKTSNNNHYLYSPGLRKFILIPRVSHDAFKQDNIISDQLLSKFSKLGYLSTIQIEKNRIISAFDIESAFINIPQIVFEVTTQCSLRCKYCCYGENYQTFSNRKAGILKFESAKILLDTLSKLSFSSGNTMVKSPLVLSFYGGEPLLNMSLIRKVVEYAKTLNFRGRDLRFSLTTNGLHLAEHIQFLKENKFSILVSLDGDYENNIYRVLPNGKSSFSKLMENLKFARTFDPNYFATIRFNSVFTDRSDINDLFEFFNSNFGRVPTLSPLHFNDGELVSNELEKMRKRIPLPDPHLLKKYPSSFMEFPIHKKIVQMLMYMTDTLYYNELSFLQSKENNSQFFTHTCIPFSKRLFLSVDGKVLPCEKVNRDYPLAYIENGELNIDFNKIAEYFNKTTSKYAPLCQKCALEYLCNHCAFTSVQINSCPDYKSIKDIECIFSELFTYLEDNPSVVKSIYDNILLK